MKRGKAMKKTVSLVLAVIFALLLIPGASAASEPVRIGGLKGPTTMGIVKLIDDAENGLTENDYEFSMAVTADELTPKFLKGELDVLCVPCNLGSVLYNNSNGAAQVAAVGTLGVLYIVENGTQDIQSLSDLKGRTIYATGKGTTPEYALDYLLEQYGLDAETDLNIEWKSEPTEVISQMSLEEGSVALMPQPFVTVAQMQLENLRVALDLTELWDGLDNGSRLVTATVIVRKEFAQQHAAELETFLREYSDSVDYVNSNLSESALLIDELGIVKAPVAERAIPYCKLVCITGESMKAAVSGYLETLFKLNPKAVGGKLPGEDFYLIYE